MGKQTSSRVTLAFLLGLFSSSVPAGAQQDLFGENKLGAPSAFGAAPDAPHVQWKARVEPLELKRGAPAEIVATYETAPPDWHIYAPDFHGTGIPTTLKVGSPSIKLLGQPRFPDPKIEEDKLLGETQRLLVGKGDIRQSFYVAPDAKPGELSFKVEVGYQSCNKTGCDLPKTEALEVKVRVADAPPEKPPAEAQAVAPGGGPSPIESTSLLAFLLLMLGGGLVALVMPCTYPMIPITISFFTKQADARQGKVLGLAVAYGAGIILVFNVIGWVFAASISTIAADKWLNLFFGLAFFVYALALFGIINLRLPSSLNQLASKATGSSGYLGVFFLGTTLVVTSFTCTVPVMGPLLTLAAKGGNWGRVTLGMTVFGATMAAPFVFLSLFPAQIRSLPRSGEWMHTLKVSLGFLELAAGLKFISNAELVWNQHVFPRELFLLLWSAIFLVGGLYLLSVFRLREEENQGIGSLRMLFGLSAVAAAFYFFFGSMGYKLDWITETLAPPYSAPRVAGAAGKANEQKSAWSRVDDDLEAGLERAKEEKKRAFINFTGVT
jgi:thiol:disulfide interchange protein DsbD